MTDDESVTKRFGYVVRLYRVYHDGARGLVMTHSLHVANADDAEKRARNIAFEYGSARPHPPKRMDYEVVREDHAVTRTILKTGSIVREEV
jgi:hypothetical protein